MGALGAAAAPREGGRLRCGRGHAGDRLPDGGYAVGKRGEDERDAMVREGEGRDEGGEDGGHLGDGSPGGEVSHIGFRGNVVEPYVGSSVEVAQVEGADDGQVVRGGRVALDRTAKISIKTY